MTERRDLQKQEIRPEKGMERASSGKTFLPRTDIYETPDDLIVAVDMPGVSQDGVDVTVEKNVLAIRGAPAQGAPTGYDLAYAEYETGSFERTFVLSDEVERDKIQATMKDGVLRLTLPKDVRSKARKIAVQTG